jgi:hypothetical protein
MNKLRVVDPHYYLHTKDDTYVQVKGPVRTFTTPKGARVAYCEARLQDVEFRPHQHNSYLVFDPVDGEWVAYIPMHVRNWQRVYARTILKDVSWETQIQLAMGICPRYEKEEIV